jgi:hypothetical protein
MLVGCVVVDDGVDRLLDRYLRLDGIEEADEPVALHVAADDGTVEDVESSDQRGRTVASVVVVIVSAAKVSIIEHPVVTCISGWVGTIDACLNNPIEPCDYRCWLLGSSKG